MILQSQLTPPHLLPFLGTEPARLSTPQIPHELTRSPSLHHRHSVTGILDTASKASLENEFGTSNEDEVIAKILEDGEIQETEVRLYIKDTPCRCRRPYCIPSMTERKLMLTSRAVCRDRTPSVRVRRTSPRARWLLIERVKGSCCGGFRHGLRAGGQTLEDRHYFITWADVSKWT